MGVCSFLTGKVQLCFFRFYTGLPCPGCGLTRAFLALLRGDWRGSFRYHPLLLLVLFTLFTALAAGIARRRIMRRRGNAAFFSFFLKLHGSKFFYPAVLAAVLALFLFRMILFFPRGPEPMVYEKNSLPGLVYSLFGERFHRSGENGPAPGTQIPTGGP